VNCYRPDFNRAARLLPLGSNPTLISIGGEARRAFRNAAVVLRHDLQDLLYWPLELQHARQARRAG
jgi:hypothetical protein